MNPAPPKPPINATRKALAAYHSELRRWAEALKRWEEALDQRETELADAMDAFEGEFNGLAPAGPDYGGYQVEEVKELMKNQQEAVKVGEEITWLEDLWKLPDRRRKKK